MPKTKSTEPTDKLLPKLSLFFFDRPWLSVIIWVVLVTFGIFSYTTLLKREGFPSINIPIVSVSGNYGASAEAIDAQISKPLSEIALKQKGVSSVTSSSGDSFVQTTVLYDESVDPAQARKDLEAAVKQAGSLPDNAKLTYAAPNFGVTGGAAKKIDATISLYDKGQNDERSVDELTQLAEQAVTYLNKHKGGQIQSYFVQSPYATVTNPATGEQGRLQRNFDRYATRQGNKTSISNAVIIGVTGIKNADVIELDDQIKNELGELGKQTTFKDVSTSISASYAPSIKQNISELQRVLLEGLVAVLVIGSLVIALRASLITVIAMVTVITITLALLFVTGYSLNVITLFALILGLSLIVDDTIIMVEALDAARRKHTTARAVVRDASRKISRAMVAATLTAAFSFAPLLFVSGILGSFIRAIPFTIISSLIISLLVALTLIPLFARFLLLGKKQLGSKGHVVELAAGVEHRIAQFIGKPMLWSKGSRLRQATVGFGALVITLAFLVSAGALFSKVTFNIFPASKDADQIAVAISYPSGTSVAKAQVIADAVDQEVSRVVGKNLVDASYYGIADNRLATLNINLVPYGEREAKAPQIVEELSAALKANVSGAQTKAYQVDVGPPVSGFTANIDAQNRPAANRLANDLAAFLKDASLTRPSGEKAHFTEVAVGNTDIYNRNDGKPVLGVSANFDGTDTSTLTTLAQTAVKDEFNEQKLANYGLSKDALSFNLGQESENQDSFKSLALAFPLVLLAIFVLLAIQFRSLLQPLLIFMAIPFSLFGVAFGLLVTDNPISFFSMLGFFALIGLSIKNTILLTDYANQARRSGLGPIDAAVAAIAERFRPLIATSLTAICSMIPLALSSPFWEGLAYTLIFGLASSTILVILVFPYFYLAGEFMRLKSRQLVRRLRRV